jgi:hypothetical protein
MKRYEIRPRRRKAGDGSDVEEPEEAQAERS